VTRAQAAGEQPTSKVTAAKALFVGLFAAALGWAGVIVAAVAVATESAWNGGATEGQRQRERGASWLDTQRAWLDQDHKARTARAKTYRDWLKAGSDPDTAPTGPSRWQKIRDAMHRLVANIAGAAQDFGRGAREGWKAAKKTRDNGGTWRETAGSRPGDDDDRWDDDAWAADWADDPAPTRCARCGRTDRPLVYVGMYCDICMGPEPHHDEATQAGTAKPDEPTPAGAETSQGSPYELGRRNCFACGQPGAVVDTPDGRNFIHDRTGYRCPAIETETEFDERTQSADSAADNPPTPEPTEGEPMTQPNPAPQQAATESNATVLRAKLVNAQTTLHKLADTTDQLDTQRAELEQQVREAEEFAAATGQSDQARTALDESNAIAAAMGAHLGEFSQGAVSAEESVRQAADGLKVAENAEDELRAAGADGRAVAPAGANA
jgi:hypothetical protein